jgi:hypothetical protein
MSFIRSESEIACVKIIFGISINRSLHSSPQEAVSQSQAKGEAVGFQSFRMRVF